MLTSEEIIAEEVKKMPSSSSPGSRPSSAASSLKMALQLTYATLVFVPYVMWSLITNLLARRKAVNGQVVLVTGAGGALGRELCLEFAKLGCAVACADIVDDETQKTVSLVKEKYPAAIVHNYHCDVTSTEDIKQMYHAVLRDIGKVDILVNNAGILRRNLIQKLDDVRLDRVIDINLKSQFKMVRQFLPDMIASNKGHVVAISSLSALCAIQGGSLYSATKHGVLGMMEALYYDLQSIPGNEVKTTCVCPYFFRNNVIHEKNVELKVKAMSARHVAQISVDAILKNKTVYVIPPMMYFFVMWLRIVPQKYADLLRRITVNPTSVAEKITIGP